MLAYAVYACTHPWVYGYLTHVCAYMCSHAYMYFQRYNPPPNIEVGRAGFAPPPPPPQY